MGRVNYSQMNDEQKKKYWNNYKKLSQPDTNMPEKSNLNGVD